MEFTSHVVAQRGEKKEKNQKYVLRKKVRLQLVSRVKTTFKDLGNGVSS